MVSEALTHHAVKSSLDVDSTAWGVFLSLLIFSGGVLLAGTAMRKLNKEPRPLPNAIDVDEHYDALWI